MFSNYYGSFYNAIFMGTGFFQKEEDNRKYMIVSIITYLITITGFILFIVGGFLSVPYSRSTAVNSSGPSPLLFVGLGVFIGSFVIRAVLFYLLLADAPLIMGGTVTSSFNGDFSKFFNSYNANYTQPIIANPHDQQQNNNNFNYVDHQNEYPVMVPVTTNGTENGNYQSYKPPTQFQFAGKTQFGEVRIGESNHDQVLSSVHTEY